MQKMACMFTIVLLFASSNSFAKCLKVSENSDGLLISTSTENALNKAGLSRENLLETLRGVSRYESSGCWSGATGNFDGQYLSAGVMQWNFGRGSLQTVLNRYEKKFSHKNLFYSELDRLMPMYGRKLFSLCRDPKISSACKLLIKNSDGSNRLQADLKEEIDSFFNDSVTRQIQFDLFNRSVTSVLSDLSRVYKTDSPKPWQVAWAVDIKTQQGDRFPSDNNVKKIKNDIAQLDQISLKKWLSSPLKWYDSMCTDRISEGIRYDCDYNLKLWPTLLDRAVSEKERAETLMYSLLIARTAQNENGKYQADAFQRRAAIALGQGSVHGTKYKFTSD